jgi:hypothetical protein
MDNAVGSQQIIGDVVDNDAEVPCFRSRKVSTVTELSFVL